MRSKRASVLSRVTAVVCLGLLAMLLASCDPASGPVAVLQTASLTGAPPFDVSFNLSHSWSPADKTLTYRLDFGDETAPASGSDLNVAVHHTYESGGTYVATLTVADTDGLQSTDALTLTVDDVGPPVGLDVGMTAPDFTAHSTSGESVTLSDYRGQVVLLDFWGAWCTPCKRSLPHLQDLLDLYANEELVAILVSTDVLESDSVSYLVSKGFTDFISLWEPGGKAGSPLTELYGLNGSDMGIPCTFLLDRDGVIRYVGHPLDLLPSELDPLF